MPPPNQTKIRSRQRPKIISKLRGNKEIKYKEKALTKASTDYAIKYYLKDLCDKIVVSRQVMKYTITLYEDIANLDEFVFTPTKELLNGCLLLATRKFHAGVPLNIFANVSGFHKKIISRHYEIIKKITNFVPKERTTNDYIVHICSLLSLNEEISSLAISISNNIDEGMLLQTLVPTTVSGCCVFIATIAMTRCNKRDILGDICRAFHLDQNTINKYLKVLQKKIMTLMPANITFVTPFNLI
uniref:TFIIB domain-containing protein n=1 Tax=Rhabditophanes sp. KR3021 TaxID=114890 RepID=A0AC35U7G2_9BILA